MHSFPRMIRSPAAAGRTLCAAGRVDSLLAQTSRCAAVKVLGSKDAVEIEVRSQRPDRSADSGADRA